MMAPVGTPRKGAAAFGEIAAIVALERFISRVRCRKAAAPFAEWMRTILAALVLRAVWAGAKSCGAVAVS